MKTLAVTGSRGWADRVLLDTTLDDLHERFRFTCLMHGGAGGADQMAGQWAQQRGVCEMVFPYASAYGKAGGIKRNIWMLEFGKPDMLAAFPLGAESKGTWHMIHQAKQRNVPIRIVKARV